MYICSYLVKTNIEKLFLNNKVSLYYNVYIKNYDKSVLNSDHATASYESVFFY